MAALSRRNVWFQHHIGKSQLARNCRYNEDVIQRG